MSEEKDGNRLARHHEHGKIWKKPTRHEDIATVFPFGNPIHNNTMIMRRSVIDGGLRYNTERDWAEDYQFWYDVSKLGRLAYYPEALVKYRLHANQVSSKHSVRQHEIAQGIQKTARNDFLQSMGFKTRFDSLEYRQIKAVAYELLEKHLPEEDFELFVPMLQTDGHAARRRVAGFCGRRQDAAAVYLEAILRHFAPIAEKPLKNAALSNRQKTG
ncbi:lacto-N-neotetraose biosynthesis glycosyl transferase [Neisseria meningitidis]|nr:lacto-N-neotetraose biosynthesis glycosyl transferase [Neisseria meningitidis]CWR07381.1 lacto-N-neotetraose biosynthesis glycosyl transferase [Neisseria meningitidis]